jgi:UDP-N-acetylglucosamine pyrophosphorylase
MQDATSEIQEKMKEAGLSGAAIKAFLHQYRKVLLHEAGLIPEDSLTPIEDLPFIGDQPAPDHVSDLASQTVLLKLNGGLGTGMGLEKAKSLLRVRDDLSFLDIIVRQYLELRSKLGLRLSLIFMNSFSTSEDSLRALAHYPELGDVERLQLLQNKVPKIDAISSKPALWPENPSLEWCPPGHGDIFPSLVGSGLLDQLLADGKRYLFVSNSDNLGATLDLRLLSYFAGSRAPFLMEVTTRTAADRKGGHLARRRSDGRLLLRESAQCPEQDTEAFQDIKRHRFFNTNNLWIHLEALRAELDRGNGLLPLPLIRNEKTIDPRDKATPRVLQLETAMGAAIECFDGATAIRVPRSRFAPVKSTSDLMSVRSDAYELDDEYRLKLIADRNSRPPIVKLEDRYKFVDQFEELVSEGVPSLAHCISMTVAGNLKFAHGVVIVGDVRFANFGGSARTIEKGIYENREVTFS